MPNPQPPEAPRRAEHWIATYEIQVLFDTDLAGRRYDHVGTHARCRHCQHEIRLRGNDDVLWRHARRHEAELSIERPAPKAVTANPTPGTIPGPQHPSCHDTVTTACPVCHQAFTPVGRQKYCSDACRAAAYRRRRDAGRPAVTVPHDRPRRPITIYECDRCGNRSLGQQYCDDCHTFMRRVGVGGECPHCSEPLAVNELLGDLHDAH